MAATIATILNQCLKEYTESTTSGALARYENEVSQRRWLDELGRLRIWAGNIGAHQTGQSSLDYRLRDASHLKSETVKILQRMLRVLRNLADVMNEQEGDQEQIDETFPGTSDTELDDENNEMTDVQVIYQSLRNIINLLFQMSMAIRRPADHDRLLGMKIKNASFFEPWAQQHVSHKFPNAEANTTRRLSAAMARQKAILKYFERHRAKLSKGLVAEDETESNHLSETVATEMALADDMDQLQYLETNSTSGLSQTSYASSMFTVNESLSIPNPPKESADNSPFECPYCCLVITIRNTKDWARHIFRDLMPYVCLSPECSTPSKLYGSRRQWYQHICEAHSVPANFQNDLNCPLCQVDIQPPLTFERHVGQHMEQLALFVLPRVDPGEEAQSEASSKSASLAVAGDDSHPGSDSDEVESLNDSDDPSTRPVVEDLGPDESHARERTESEYVPRPPYSHFPSRYARRGSTGNESASRDDWSTQSREGSPGQQHLLESTDLASVATYHPYSGALRRDFGYESPGEKPKGSEKGYIPDNVAYSYTSPREQFDRDYPVRPRRTYAMPVMGRRTHLLAKPRRHSRSSKSNVDMSDDDLQDYRHEPRVGRTRKVDGSDVSSLDGIGQTLHSLQLSPSSKKTPNQMLSESDKQVEGIVTGSSPDIKPAIPLKGILKHQRGTFPEDPNPIREDVAPLRQAETTYIPPGARWTKIDRRLVNPSALQAGNERFEERSEYVIVLRVLTKEEIQAYAVKTQQIRDDRHKQHTQEERLSTHDSE